MKAILFYMHSTLILDIKYSLDYFGLKKRRIICQLVRKQIKCPFFFLVNKSNGPWTIYLYQKFLLKF